MPNETRGRLDNAIDRAVRGMMQVDPAPGLRIRVVDRIAKTPARPSLRFSFAAAAALLVVAFASIGLFRALRSDDTIQPGTAGAPAAETATVNRQPDVTTQAPPKVPAPAAVTPPRGAVEPPRVLPRPSVLFSGPRDRVRAASVRPGAIGNVDDAGYVLPPTTPVPEGLVPISPIAIAPISIAPIVIPPLTVTPLSVRR